MSIDTRNGTLLAKVWLMRVGRVKLYLMDCDVEGNSPQDRELTSRLYGGDHRTRIRQELVLGVGGVKALRALGIDPGVYHLNEGHKRVRPTRGDAGQDGDRWAELRRRPPRGRPADLFHHAHAGTRRPRPVDPALVEEHLGRCGTSSASRTSN